MYRAAFAKINKLIDAFFSAGIHSQTNANINNHYVRPKFL